MWSHLALYYELRSTRHYIDVPITQQWHTKWWKGAVFGCHNLLNLKASRAVPTTFCHLACQVGYKYASELVLTGLR